MNTPAPLIFTHRQGPVPLTVVERIIALTLAVGCLAVLCVGAWLRPSVTGTGTHQQLGLMPCGFYQRTGIPCPSCGYTTAFTYFSHGNWVASFYVQPMGFLLALISGMTVWAGFYVAITGRPVHRLLTRIPSRYYAWPLIIFALLAWGYKILLTLCGHDGWRGF